MIKHLGLIFSKWIFKSVIKPQMINKNLTLYQNHKSYFPEVFFPLKKFCFYFGTVLSEHTSCDVTAVLFPHSPLLCWRALRLALRTAWENAGLLTTGAGVEMITRLSKAAALYGQQTPCFETLLMEGWLWRDPTSAQELFLLSCLTTKEVLTGKKEEGWKFTFFLDTN